MKGKSRKIQNSRSSLLHKFEATLDYKRLGVKKIKRERKEKEMLAGKKKE